MQIMGLITALPGAAAQGLIWGIMAIGVYITFRILDIADLTVDGTLCTGGAVCIMMMLSGHNVWVSMLAATGAGLLAGLATGFWRDSEDLRQQWSVDKEFNPEDTEEHSEKILHMWHKAVARAQAWEELGD
mgnify:CR=1 FL=1